MAAIASITAVKPTPNTVSEKGTYGATITPGDAVYFDDTDNLWKLADANLSVTAAAAKGIAITGGVSGDSGYVATGGSIIFVGPTMSVGENFYVGPTAGDIVTESDVVTGCYVTRLGAASLANQFDIDIVVTGIMHA